MSNNEIWYDAKPDDYHKRLVPYVDHLDVAQSYRRQQNELYYALYGDREARGMGHQLLVTPTRDGTHRLTYNLIQSICDTAQSKIAQHRNMPFILTEDGNWLQQEKAKKLNRWNEGQFYLTDYWEKAQDQFLDATIAGTGFVYAFNSDPNGKGAIGLERVFPDEIKADDALAIYGEPPELHREKLVSRRALLDLYRDSPKKKQAIAAAPAAKLLTRGGSPHSEDLIRVLVTWRKASREGVKDGLEVHCIENATLAVIKQSHSYFPIIPFRWTKPSRGYFGRGIASQLVGMQFEINTLLRVISKSLRLVGVPRILLPIGSNVNPALFTDEIGGIIPHAPNFAPTVMAQQVLPPEVYNWFETMIRRAYEKVGINELTATGRKPSGLDAAKALQTYSDMQGERFAMVEQRWEQHGIAVTKVMNGIARDIAEEHGDFQISAHNSAGYEPLSWKKDLSLTQDDVVYKAWPQNLFSKTPQAKLQQAQELFQSGLIDKNSFLRLMDYPDFESATSVAKASSDSVYRTAALIMERDEYRAPESFINLQEGLVIMNGLLLKFEMANAPAHKLDMLRTWIAQALYEIERAKPPAPAAPTPTAAPAEAPVSPTPLM